MNRENNFFDISFLSNLLIPPSFRQQKKKANFLFVFLSRHPPVLPSPSPASQSSFHHLSLLDLILPSLPHALTRTKGVAHFLLPVLNVSPGPRKNATSCLPVTSPRHPPSPDARRRQLAQRSLRARTPLLDWDRHLKASTPVTVQLLLIFAS